MAEMAGSNLLTTQLNNPRAQHLLHLLIDGKPSITRRNPHSVKQFRRESECSMYPNPANGAVATWGRINDSRGIIRHGRTASQL